jgi:Exo-beta-D-glucosaminidase Ig-fold domain/Concanavalin A-like lectin/glucanases superfamily/Glycosyl hydrolases family 2/Glycosyl hydrolases family 2, sugar binding domain/Glycosyl hydrolases family 2, TIM barrel domain
VKHALRNFVLIALLASPFASINISAQSVQAPAFTVLPRVYGPYSGHFQSGGRGLVKPLPAKDPILGPRAVWTLSAWVEFSQLPTESVFIAGAGDPADEDSRFFTLVDGKPALRFGKNDLLRSPEAITAKSWHLLAASFDGNIARLFVDGAETTQGTLSSGPIKPQLALAPVEASCEHLPCPHFGGRIAQFILERDALSREEIAALAKEQPDFSLIAFEEGSKPWALQVVQFAGNTAPQDPSTLPHRNAPFSQPKTEPLPPANTALQPAGAGDWVLAGGWKLVEAPKVSANAEQIATAGFNSGDWMPATVPGTVLTTMIARGRYPDPDYGLDNLAIPEHLNRQDYWYRAEFASPQTEGRSHVSLVLDGINYHAEVWLNGQHLGSMTGAFTRGVFDVSKSLRADGRNALAILVSPAPHPGIPNVQSIAFGAGLNGGAMAIDGPTFMSTEGWDWMPPIRDRDSGLWQDVHLVATGPVAIADPQIITHLPLPDITQADITVKVPLENFSSQPLRGTLTASFEGVHIRKEVTVAPGETTVALSPKDFPELHLDHPRLWWPNGYGKPELYHLQLSFATEGNAPSEKNLQFGVREVTYELSLLDNTGALRRVDYDPAIGRDELRPQVDVTHEGMRQVPDGWAASITDGEDNSPVFRTIADTRATPYLTLKVNGVRIAVRGGSWGMDDSRKRSSREHLEPYFRFDRDANLNIIRNWQGQNTEETFYDLADKYGMLVWNDFWEVTMDSNAEAEDPQLFLRNAQDTILHYRNHPSIVMWCGRNEGVPQPVINKGLIELTHSLDGTRYYSPSSNQINLQKSGPYSYEDPADYYTKLDPGFAVEVGTPSLPTLEWFSRWIPKVDRWPISDDWAYHNWHPHDELNQHLEAQLGAADSLEDYERKAQMMNYVDYRAIFEGFNAHLWAPNSGRLLWMTQPAWPSTLWGILSSDYDTQASYYATKKACEPMHVQLDLSNNDVSVVNTTREALHAANVSADIFSLDSKLLLHRNSTIDAAPDDVTRALNLDLSPLMGDGVVFVRLKLQGQKGELLSENFYWRAASDAGYRALDRLGSATVTITARLEPESSDKYRTAERRIKIRLKNTGTVAALNTKLVTVDALDGSEVLPAYYSDNYISLLPGEERSITIELPAEAANRALSVKLRGWNAVKTTTDVLHGQVQRP